MSRGVKVEEHEHATYSTGCRMGNGDDFEAGVAYSEQGIVAVTLSTWRRVQSVCFEIIIDGRKLTRWEEREHSRAITWRGAVTLARKWAREVAS